MEVDLDKISQDEALGKILKEYQILDITVEDAPLEEVIGIIYEKGKIEEETL